MASHRTCVLLPALFLVCWMESALGSNLNSSLCNGLCLKTMHAALFCEVAFEAPPCNAGTELCCGEVRHPGALRTTDDESVSLGKPVWSARVNNYQGSARETNNAYLNILKLILTAYLRAAVASEYKAIADKPTPANSTERYDPTWPEENDIFKTESPIYASKKTSTTPSTTSSSGVQLAPSHSFDGNVYSQGHAASQGTLPSHNGSFSRNSTLAPLAQSAPPTASIPNTEDVETSSEKLTYPCPGSCMSTYFTWFCERTSTEYGCSDGRVCCLPTTTTPPPEIVVPACTGTCIIPQLTGLCKKPARLLLKTTTCSGSYICCSETPRLW
ncbi:uncharacterized protein [Dermacentor andersoni]|uniref:uncharacterized protein n=1 Tax=Dermacentor andersoni TaxID=34620 RepID=UPI002155C945|nr:uncharacterized protein LOC126531406 [Dermacentor andersoni]